MKRIATISFSIIAVLFILVVVGVLAAPSFIDFSQYKEQAREQIKAKTGHDVHFNGDVALGIFPAPHVSLKDVVVDAPVGFSNKVLASFESLDVNIELAPLFRKEVQVTSVNLVKPNINLEVKQDGTQNWMTPELQAMQSDKPADDGAAQAEAGSEKKAPSITLSGVEISDGQISYAAAGAKPVVIKDINVAADADSLKGPFTLKGSLNGFDQTLTIDADVAELKPNGAPVELKARGSAKPAGVSFDFDGNLDTAAQSAQGQTAVSFDGGSIKGLMNATKEKVAFTGMTFNGFGHNVTGDFSSTLNPIKFNGDVSVDGTPLTLSGTYDQALTIAAKAGTIDLDKITRKKSGVSDSAMPTMSGNAGGASKGGINVPMPINFDVEVASLITGGKNIKDVKAKGKAEGSAASLSSFSVGNVAGASFQGKGSVSDLNALSGIQANVSGNIPDVAALAGFAGVDPKAVPPQIKSAAVDIVASGNKSAMDVDATIKALEGSLSAKGKVQSPMETPLVNNLALQIKHPNFAKALKAFSPNAPAYDSWNRPADFSANLAMKDKSYTLSDIKAKFGGTNMSGTLNYNGTAAKPDIQGSLNFGDLVMRSTGTAPAGGAEKGTAPARTSASKWSNDIIDSKWMNQMNIDLDVKASSIVYETWDLKTPSIDFVLKDGVLDIRDLKAGLYGGNLSMASVMKPANADGTGMDVNLNAQFANVDLENLAGSLAGRKLIKTSGKANFTTQIAAAGISQKVLISSMNGQGSLTGQNIVLEGVDVARFARAMSVDNKPGDTALGLWKTSTKGGSTQFDTMDGAYKISQGIVNISKLTLDGPTALVDTTGTVNLPAWTVATKHSFTAKGTEVPPFTIEVSGSLDNPGNTFGQGAIQNYLQQKLNRKLDKVLGDKLNLESGDAPIEQKLLNKFLGGRTQQAPAAANDNPAPVQGTETVEPAGGVEQENAQPAQEQPVLQEPQKTPEEEAVDAIRSLFD